MSTRAVPAIARVVAAVLCLLPEAVRHVSGQAYSKHAVDRRVVDRHGGLATDLAVVLAVRYLVQAGAIGAGHGLAMRTRVSIESLHAFSMGAAAVAMPRRRRTALAGLALAAGVTAADVTQQLAKPAHERPGRAR